MSDFRAFKALSLGVTIFVVVLAAACTIHLRDDDNQPQPASSVVREGDPQTAELERCRSVGYEQKDRLAECRKVWAEQRRHFIRQNIDTPRNPARPDPDATPPASVKDQSRLPPGLFPAPQPTERQMGGTGIIDQFLETFTRYIDSGFGLVGNEVGYLASTLAAIDITLAGLFWVWGSDEDIIARLVKKTMFVGVFAFLIGNWNTLARIVFESFAGLGLKASGTGLSSAEFLRPGRIAQVGLEAGRPILESISRLMGYVSFFENFVQIVVLLFAWIVVLLTFFILAIQLFITLIEFKLTTLAGFVLIPFGLFGKTAFAAERVLGNVISSGVKVLVLAVIVGIGSTLFSQFTSGFGGNQPTIENAMALVLAALSLLGLGIFGPGIANGIVSGGPQLGAGAAVGTTMAAGGVVAAGAALAAGGAALTGSMVGGAARGGSALIGGAASAFRTGAQTGEAGATSAASPLRSLAARFGRSNAAGDEAGGADASSGGAPAWVRRMRGQAVSHGVSATTQALRSGDHGGGGASVDLRDTER